MRRRAGRELTRDQRVRQAISRLSFGARPGDFDRVSAMGVDRWIDQQLAPETIQDADADRVLSTFETQRKQVFELIADHPDPQELQQRFNQRKLATGGPRFGPARTVCCSCEPSSRRSGSPTRSSQPSSCVPSSANGSSSR